MVFAHDTEIALQAAVALANSALDPDTLETVEELTTLFTDFDYSGRLDGDEAELDAVRALRGDLLRLLTAERDDAVVMINAMLRETRALPQLERHDQFDWHIHAVERDAPLATRIVVETAMAMVDVIRADDLSRLSRCART